MTSFVHVDMPADHPGMVRAERACIDLSRRAHAVSTARAAGASLLLAAIVSPCWSSPTR